jgi:hypothetical protein
MRTSVLATLLTLTVVTIAQSATADETQRRWWRREWREPYWAMPCEIKLEAKRGELKREVKCVNGVGASWRGEWKEEFRDGDCLVKLEATREVFKEEVKCSD